MSSLHNLVFGDFFAFQIANSVEFLAEFQQRSLSPESSTANCVPNIEAEVTGGVRNQQAVITALGQFVPLQGVRGGDSVFVEGEEFVIARSD